MKTLQNNYTTPEQSKQLLELGIPMNSADCIWYNPYYDGKDPELAEISVWKGKYPQRMDKYTYPCWSVGRLIEILHITYKQDWREYLYLCTTETCSKGLVNQIMLYLQKYHTDHDFSKLEE